MKKHHTDVTLKLKLTLTITLTDTGGPPGPNAGTQKFIGYMEKPQKVT